jgi:hypothetical protein
MNDQEYRRHILEVLRQPLGRVFSAYNLPHVLDLIVLTGLAMEGGASGLAQRLSGGDVAPQAAGNYHLSTD